MKNSKFRNVQGRTFLNDGIRAASKDPQHIKSTKKAAGLWMVKLPLLMMQLCTKICQVMKQATVFIVLSLLNRKNW